MLQKIKETISVLSGIAVSFIDEETVLAELEIDSLTMLKIIMELENVYGVHFEDEEIVEIRTVSDIEEKISEKLSQ